MNKRKKNILKAGIYVTAVVLSALLLAVFRHSAIKIGTDIVLKSAESFLPSEGLTLHSVTKNTAENTSQPQKTTSQEATEVTTEASSSTAEETVTASTELTEKITDALSQSSFTDTDEDILALIKSTKKASKKDEKDGAISEYTYKNDGVTDKYGLVRVKNVNETAVNIKKLLDTELDLQINKDEPSVLIFHTHTTETYQILDRDFYAVGALTRSNDKSVNMVRVGQEIAEEIEKSGYKVIHDTVIHDSTYNSAYSHSRKTVEEYLKEYPSVKIVLDIHRDAIERSDGTKIKPVATVQGKKAAQIMIISGCQEEGNGVEGFEGWKDNLVFAVHLQNTLEQLFEGITRPLYFSPRKYNMDLTPFSLLVEVGSDANTLEEAVYTGRCLGKAVSEILKKYEV